MQEADEIKNEFGNFIHTVLNKKPVLFKADNDHIIAMSKSLIMSVFQANTFISQFVEENGIITATLQGFDLVVEAKSREEAITKLTVGLIDYAQDYFNDFQLYFDSPNRKEHFPYIIKVLLADSFKQVEEMIYA